jgi:rod shape-determining protein MreB and related proteins
MAFSLATDLAIDLGTANTCVFARGRGVILSEPSLIAFNTATGAIEAVGDDARAMLGRNPEHLRPVKPIRDGVIADFDAAEKMLTHFIRKTNQQVGGWARPRVVIGVPAQITPVERRAVKDSAFAPRSAKYFWWTNQWRRPLVPGYQSRKQLAT